MRAPVKVSPLLVQRIPAPAPAYLRTQIPILSCFRLFHSAGGPTCAETHHDGYAETIYNIDMRLK